MPENGTSTLQPGQAFSLMIPGDDRCREVVPIVERANALQVSDKETCEEGIALTRSLIALRDRIKGDFYGPDGKSGPVPKMFSAHRSLTALYASYVEPLEHAESRLRTLAGNWLAEQRRIEEEAARRLLEQKRKEEEERRLSEAVALEAAGETAVAEAILATPVVIPAPVLPSTAVPVAGVGTSTTTTWRGECVDLLALAKAIAAGAAPITLIEPSTSGINKIAAALRSECKIPGIRVYPVTGLRIKKSF